jgi:hypothetical protein
MKTNYFFLVWILLLLPLSASTQVTYTFDPEGNGYTAEGGATYTNMTQFPSAALGGGTFETKTLAELGAVTPSDGNATIVFHGATRVSPTNTASVDLNAFSGSDNQQVIWKTYFKADASTSKGNGVVLRAQSSASGYSAGVRRGYFFNCYGAGVSGSVKFRIGKLDATSGFTNVKSETTLAIPGFTTGPLYLKAKAVGTKLYFEYSTDGITFNPFAGSPYSDGTYSSGTVQLAWALGAGSNLDQYIDDVVISNLDVPKLTINGNNKFIYDGTNDAISSSFDVNVAGYKYFTNQNEETPVITYEYLGIGNTSYEKSSTAPVAVGKYMVVGTAVSANYNQSATDTLAFEILPSTYNKYYTFVDDVTGVVADSTYSSTHSHMVQAGVGTMLGYTTRANMLQPAIANGITTLAKFGTTDSISSNYSVIWKSYSTATGQKRGVILRADGKNTFTKIKGSLPVANIVNTGKGYMFYINNLSENATQMDIRKLHDVSDSAMYNSPTIMATNATVPGSKTGEASWYKATAKDSVLTFEYSADGTNWHIACTAIDSVYSQKTQTFPARYFSGTTQLSGINSGGTSYYYDYILYSNSTDIYSGLTKTESTAGPIALSVKGGIRLLVNTYSIYNIQGMLIRSAQNPESSGVEFLNPGIYIVRSGLHTQKLHVSNY